MTVSSAADMIPWQGDPLEEGSVTLIDVNGLAAVRVDTPVASATVYLQGAHLASWAPAGQDSVLFMSPASAYAPGVALRGGVPVCAPWFGNGPDGSRTPNHGWARLRQWGLESVRAMDRGAVELTLGVRDETSGIELTLRLAVGARLSMTLTATNIGDHDARPELALHAYWAVDAQRVAVEGLDGAPFTDRTMAGEPQRPASAFPALTGQTVDRIYALPGREPITLHDQDRDIILAADADQTVTWNPGAETCRTAADLADDDWTRMLCVEAVRVRDQAPVIAPGASASVGMDARVLPRLGRNLIETPARPTRIIQFGEGNFLRAFVDWQVQQLNERAAFNGGVAVVQPRPGGRVARLEAQDRLYTVQLQGLKDGETVRSHEVITAINSTVDPYKDWEGFLALAEIPEAAVIVSNTTEAGIAINPDDTAQTRVPLGFPAKLTRLLERRRAAGLPGFVIIPCELIDDNGTALHDAVAACACVFGLGQGFLDWLDAENTFCSSLVDRIVPGFPADASRIWDELGYRDDQLVCAEPFMLWVIQGPDEIKQTLPFTRAGLGVVLADDLKPYHDRKVFLLNGPHTTMSSLARNAGFRTVGQVMDDDVMLGFIRAEMRQEIFPVLDLPDEELTSFAAQVEERFANPFVHHELDSIALNAVSKFTARLLPILKAHVAAGHPLPRRIVLALAGLLWTYSGTAPAAPVDTEETIARFTGVTGPGGVAAVLADTSLWGENLDAIDGLSDVVGTDLDALRTRGAQPLIAELSQEGR